MGNQYSIGIDLGGTNIAVGLVDSHGRIAIKMSTSTNIADSPAEIVDAIAALIDTAIAKAGIPLSLIGSVGIGTPGIVNKQTGIVEYYANFNWHNVPLRDMLADRIDRDVCIDNDANTAALGEYLYGAARECKSSLLITLGTGVGGGLIECDRIYTGKNYAGLEIGHMVIEKNGRPCRCGRRGCFERYASASGLIITTKMYMKKTPGSIMWEIARGDLQNVDGHTAFDAMQQKDAAATDVCGAFFADLACGITNLINIFQPDAVVIGGGISHESETLLMPLREKVAAEVYSRNCKENATLLCAALGNDAGIIGAASLHITSCVS